MSAETAALRKAVEARRNDWLHEFNRRGDNPKGVEANYLRARLQELAWVLRLIDGAGGAEAPCEHRLKIPHRRQDGGWRWTCSECYLDLPDQ